MRLRACVAVLVTAFALLPQAPASAYPQDPNSCNDRSITYYFDTVDWYGRPTERSWARAAIELWEQPLDYAGARLMTMTDLPWGQIGGTGDVSLELRDMPPSAYGTANCSFFGGPYAELNMNYLSSQKFVWKVARHELGHLAGLEHSGSNDSWNSDDPATMSTCIDYSTFLTTNKLSQDDAAYVNWSHGVLANRQLEANIGFEQGTSYWGRYGGTVEWLSTGGATGPGNVRYKTEQSSHYLYQTVNLAVGTDDESYRAVVNYRQGSLGGYGQLTGTMYRKQIDYTGDNGCAYADGLQNLNSWTASTAYVALVSTGRRDPTLTTSWVSAASGWYNPANVDGYVLQYRVYSHSQTTSYVPQWVYLDNLRGEGT